MRFSWCSIRASKKTSPRNLWVETDAAKAPFPYHSQRETYLAVARARYAPGLQSRAPLRPGPSGHWRRERQGGPPPPPRGAPPPPRGNPRPPFLKGARGGVGGRRGGAGPGGWVVPGGG